MTLDVTPVRYAAASLKGVYMQRIIDAVTGIRIGEPTTYRNLTMFPLFGLKVKNIGYLTLDEALEQKHSVITEVSEGGSVPDLRFVNSGSRRVFLLDGEQLIGAKQNRVLNLSILVSAGKTIIIPISCVEAGRWRHRTSQFSSSQSLHYSEGSGRWLRSALRCAPRGRGDRTRLKSGRTSAKSLQSLVCLRKHRQ
jgi:hypothetical protein